MSRSSLSFAFLLSFLTITFFIQWVQAWARLPLVWAAIAAAFFSTLLLLFFRKRLAAMFIACLLGTACSVAAVALATRPHPEDHIALLADKRPLDIRGVITEPPSVTKTTQSYVVEAKKVVQGSTARETEGKFLVRKRKGPVLHYGDEVRVTGKLRKPWPIKGYRYDLALQRQGIFAIATAATIEKIAAEKGNPFFAALIDSRIAIEARITKLLPSPHSSLLIGLLTGGKQTMPKNLIAAFNATGLTHIIAISGYNITMIITVFTSLLFWLPLRWRLVPSILGIILFTLFVGAGASVVRAAIMGGLALFALQSGRERDGRLLILWAAFFMLLRSPSSMWNDASFQLSFLAITGLVEASPVTQHFCRFLPERFGLRETAAATLAAQSLTSPWIAFLFGQFSLIAPLSNVIVLPLVPVATATGFGWLLISNIPPPFDAVLKAIAWLPLQAIIGLTQMLARIPFACLTIPHMSNGAITAVYAVIVGEIYILRRRIESAHASMEKSI